MTQVWNTSDNKPFSEVNLNGILPNNIFSININHGFAHVKMSTNKTYMVELVFAIQNDFDLIEAKVIEEDGKYHGNELFSNEGENPEFFDALDFDKIKKSVIEFQNKK